MTGVPETLLRWLEKSWTEEIRERILAGYHEARVTTLRVNTLKTRKSDIVRELGAMGWAWREVEWYEHALILPGRTEPEVLELPMAREGRVYLQSLSAMIPVRILNPQPGESILDMTAAPGGKTTQICAETGNKAGVTACERDSIRAERMKHNLSLQGARATVITGDARQLPDLLRFDRVLLDAPCTGSGTIQVLSEGGERQMTEGWKNRILDTQAALLAKGLSLLKPGGCLVYATCSVLQEENEQQVRQAVDRGWAESVPLEPFSGEIPFLPGETGLTVCPDRQYEGFFVSCLRRTDKGIPAASSMKRRGRKFRG